MCCKIICRRCEMFSDDKIYAWKTSGGFVYKLQRQNNDKYCWVGLENSKQIWGGSEFKTIYDAVDYCSRVEVFYSQESFFRWALEKWTNS